MPAENSPDSALPSPAPLEITVQETQRLLTTEPARVWLLDVREPFEAQIAQLPGATLIPMRTLPARLAELPRDKWILVHCHHGGRSLRVTEWLRAQGLAQVSNVAGGIDAWAVEIDPGVQRY